MPLMRAGVASVTQMRVEANPGRAGSMRTSGAGASEMASDLPSSLSMQTMRRTGFTSSMALRELRAHHHERHDHVAALARPQVPVAELHHDVAWPHHQRLRVEHEHALAPEHDAVIDGL